MTKGERIKYLRRKSKISQDELANMLEISKQAISKYENGVVTNIPSDKIEQMADIFGVNPAYLMGWTEEEKLGNILSLKLTSHEREVITAYRNSPGMQPSVDRLLCIENDEGLTPNEALNGVLPTGEAVGGNANIKTK